MKYRVKVNYTVWDVYEVEADSESEAYELAEDMAGDKSLNEMNSEFEGCTILDSKGDDTEDAEDDPLEGCSEDFRKAIAYVKENISEEDRDIIRAKCSKLYKQHIIPDENSVDDSVITDLLEEYGDENDLPEGWWESEGIDGLLTLI
jgi:hypothetical protein